MKKLIVILMVAQVLFGAQYSRDSVNNIVIDSKNRLEWQDDTNIIQGTWRGAINRCDAMVLDGKSDWRLPNINELRSILDYQTNREKSIFINPIPVSRYAWSSSSMPNLIFYVLGFPRGFLSKTSSSYYIRCVRGGI